MSEDKLDKLVDAIAIKGLSIIDKILGRFDTKLDDPDYMKKFEEGMVNVIKRERVCEWDYLKGERKGTDWKRLNAEASERRETSEKKDG